MLALFIAVFMETTLFTLKAKGPIGLLTMPVTVCVSLYIAICCTGRPPRTPSPAAGADHAAAEGGEPAHRRRTVRGRAH
ncbi:hypothetical protein [Stenotrophomonas sp.]|uniref:hypothetical protein n=1 Tax=Stenotrophomonas sp. TaxID=69392 RepID=UPI0028A0340A|nr:hypothetical protein [Stenotrophomonas sp.]